MPSSAMPMTISSASSAAAASAAPSRIRCGAAGQDRLVLPGRRLALGAVDHDDRREVLPAAGVEHGADLAGEREAGAAAAAQLDPVGEPDQLAGGQRREPAVDLLMGEEVQAAVLVEARGDPRNADRGDRRNLGRAQLLPLATATSNRRQPLVVVPAAAAAASPPARLAAYGFLLAACRRARRDAMSTSVGVSSGSR